MATATLRRSAWGLATPRDDRPWWERALCANRPEWTEPKGLSRQASGPTITALRLAHICLHHCPVLAQCQRDVDSQRPAGPAGVLQAGVLWREYHQQPVELLEIGHGAWCGRPA